LILTFYLMVGYVLTGQRAAGQSWGDRLLGGRSMWLFGSGAAAGSAAKPQAAGSVGATGAARLVEVDFAVACVAIGLGELCAGVALWYPLFPPGPNVVAEARAHVGHREAYLMLLNVGGYATLAWQLCFPFFAWRPGWRWLLLGGAVVGWLGAALLWK